ncbi:dihydrolipoamide acetyltransferase family protein [Mycolicibacterium sp. Y3]
MIEFKMPALGSDMDEGTLNEWLVKPGDTVHRGQVVAVVETTKAAVEVECWHDGIVSELLVPVGQTISVGTPLATLTEEGEEGKAADTPIPAVQPAPAAAEHRRWVSPAARRMALARHVDLDAVEGTGPQGSVTIADVERTAASSPGIQPHAGGGRAEQMRKSIAAAMGRSKREIPHYYLAHEVNMDAALNWMSAFNAERSITERVLPAALLLKAVAVAAQRFPEFNGFWRDDDFRPAAGVHVGVAISLRGGGLVAPAVHDVPGKKLDEVMADLADVVARARAGSLRSSEISDPTITVTNLGDQGVDTVFGVIYPPQVALIGFGAPAQRVCAVDGGIRIATTVHATLAADHRASDGHRGALFLAAIAELLQQPHTLEG